MSLDLEHLTPARIVSELDHYIVGQKAAKRAVAIALRNRWRRQQVAPELRREIYPKNILMIGPTGVGKTEIARRLARIVGAPFIKVEATKYTEVGYVGRDVESMVRDLMNAAVNLVKQEMRERVRPQAAERMERQLVELLRANEEVQKRWYASSQLDQNFTNWILEELRKGEFEDLLVEVQVPNRVSLPVFDVFGGNVPEELASNLENLMGALRGRSRKLLPVKAARQILLEEAMDRMLDQDQVVEIARERVQNLGIIFIDEIDKITGRSTVSGPDVSREGVQRDLLPIVEGSQVNTKYGVIDTSHILFIAAGAFHTSKPSDLIPELQGRFPIRVELEPLTIQDFKDILTQPRNSLISQYQALLAVEGVEMEFTPEAIDEMAHWAWEVNSRDENIGARRLHTLLEAVLEELSFSAPEIRGQKVVITPAYVRERIKPVAEDRDLSRYIL